MSRGPLVPIVQVDAFTAVPFAGNPAAVCVLEAPREASWMQRVAAEMNLSETAFLQANNDGFALRWFTPTTEVDLCGHATLASAHVLWESGRLPLPTQAVFHTRSGVLTADRDGEWIELNFPAKVETETEPPPELLPALGVGSAIHVGRNQFDYLVELDSEDAIHALSPDFAALKKLPVRGVMVTSHAKEYDFISRFFAPGAGVDEDPVTGSAHCALAPYWANKLGRIELRAFQASQRGGFLRLRVDGDRVRLAGQAVTVLRGEVVV